MFSATSDGGVALGTHPVLPFALGTLPFLQEDPRIPVILRSLEALHALAIESKRDLDALRETSEQILGSLGPNAGPVTQAATPEAVGPAAGALLRLKILGVFEVEVRGRAVSQWPSKKSRLLLAYLAMERGRMVPRDVLVDLFWPETSPARGSNNLSIAIHQIRSALAEVDAAAAQGIVVRQGLCGLEPRHVDVDLWEFQSRLADARHALENREFEAARRHLIGGLAACGGELLESDPYEEWTVEPRRVWNAAHHQALAWLAAQAAESGHWNDVIDYASRMLSREPCDEAGHRWLMLAQWRLGNRPQALQQYRLCEEALAGELGLEPSEETRRLAARIRENR